VEVGTWNWNNGANLESTKSLITRSQNDVMYTGHFRLLPINMHKTTRIIAMTAGQEFIDIWLLTLSIYGTILKSRLSGAGS
jgi:hypothetical protein